MFIMVNFMVVIKLDRMLSVAVTILTTVMVSVVLQGCDNNQIKHKSYTPAEARIFFANHRAQLEQLVELIQGCKYAKEIDSNPAMNSPTIDMCDDRKPDYRNRIARKLADIGILAVIIDWWPHSKNSSSEHHLSSVSFLLTSHGILNAGVGSAIWYFVKPVSDARKMVALTPQPHHWFFKKLGSNDSNF